jgi:hypothetical protein
MYWNGHCVSVNLGGLVMSCWIGDDFVMLYPMALSDRRHENNLLDLKPFPPSSNAGIDELTTPSLKTFYYDRRTAI